MAYYRPGDRLGGYPVGPDLGEDGPAYGGPSGGYVDERYERGREYAPGYYGAGRSGGYRYGREGYAYGQGYPPQQQVVVPPPIEYVEPEPSDLGMGLRDSHLVSRHHGTDYGAGYGPSDLAGYGGAPGYGRTEYDDAEVRRLRRELEHERHRKHEFEVATAAALGYGLHERHEKSEAEEELERYGRGNEKHHHRHHLFRGEGGLE